MMIKPLIDDKLHYLKDVRANPTQMYSGRLPALYGETGKHVSARSLFYSLLLKAEVLY